MSLSEALRFLDSLQGSGIQPGLERMRALCEAAQHPELAASSVLIAGTNGKGSTAATLASILNEAGHRTALYTSPHLVRLEERWRLGNEDVPSHELERGITELRKVIAAADVVPTYFEALTLLAFILFQRWESEWNVLEVGMGGRLDATNVAEPVVSLITPIGFDHMEYLGDSIEAIAREKSGVMREGRVTLTSAEDATALDALRAAASRCGATLESIDERCVIRNIQSTWANLSFDLETPDGKYSLMTPLRGPHQARNVALAVRAAELLGVAADAIVRGVASAVWRGRLERHEVGSRRVVVDGGHNPHAIEAILPFVDRELRRPRTVVFAMMRDKNVEESLAKLLPSFDRAIFTKVDETRGTDPDELRSVAERLLPSMPTSIHHDPVSALEEAMEGESDVLIAGSLYLAGDASVFLDRITGRSAAIAQIESETSQE